MEPDASWVAILGAVAGVFAALHWLVNDIRNLTINPKLVISEGPYVRDYQFVGTTRVWRFVNLEVTNKRTRTALRCVAKAKIIKHPNNVSLREKDRGLHWADVPYSGRSTGAEPVDIGAESRRLDVAFAVPSQSGQSNLAMPIALFTMWNHDSSVPQAVLPHGEYTLKIEVSCANGRGDSKTIRLISPNNWQDLQAEEVKSIRWYRLLFAYTATWLKRCLRI